MLVPPLWTVTPLAIVLALGAFALGWTIALSEQPADPPHLQASDESRNLTYADGWCDGYKVAEDGTRKLYEEIEAHLGGVSPPEYVSRPFTITAKNGQTVECE